MKRTIAAVLTLIAASTSGAATPLAMAQRPVLIHLATVAPKGSEWELTLREMGARWQEATAGAIRLRVHAGGGIGDESEVIRTMRVAGLTGRGLNAAAISNDGLADIEPAAFALNLPLVFDSYEEWDFVRRHVNPILEKRLEEKGFIVLAWSDVGWVHFFSREPLHHPDQLREWKLAASATDTDQVDLLKSLGFNPVPTTQDDLFPALETGRVDVLYLPIIFAEATQIFRHVGNMTALAWAPLQGAIVVHKGTWDGVAPEYRDAMRRISREIGDQLRADNRDHERRSLEAMLRNGLNQVEVDDDDAAAWKRLTEDNFDKIRGKLVDEEMFDLVIELRDEYRASTTRSGAER
ncbi:MAG: TRAP transporter substrate-binding protein DctP [Acidobacteriota bacterium]|jgi:TRAP-type C4-dicarboxylate transport system substrate-binding protein